MNGISVILFGLLVVTSVIFADPLFDDETPFTATTPKNPTAMMSIDPHCVNYSPAHETLFPNLLNCNHYYKCFGGQFSEWICPSGLLFSLINNKCVEPQYAECIDSAPPNANTCTATTTATTPTTTTYMTTTHTTTPPTTTIESATTTTRTTPQTTPSTTTIRTTTPDDEDPRCTGSQTSYWPHPRDCHLYIECYQGDSYEMVCPDDKYFSEMNKSCVYANESECCTSNPSTPSQ